MLNRSLNRGLLPICALVVALGLAGCSSGAATSAGSTTSTTTSTTVATDDSSTTSVTTSTVPATTTAGAPTVPSTTVAPEPLVLRADGLGPFGFDDFPAAIIDAITAQLGAPTRNDLLLYEDLSDFASLGVYTSFDGPYYYSLAYPVGRTTCWTGDFCVEFGGPSAANLSFIGWWYTGPPTMMASSSNLTIGARWSSFPSMIVFATCYTTGGGTHHDIELDLQGPAGWEWLVSDGVGGFVENLPDPALTRVSYMSAGQQPFQAFADC
ncbi:MAG: hypothetical protein ABL953_10105 [Ilumatobacteraceae bacterium]